MFDSFLKIIFTALFATSPVQVAPAPQIPIDPPIKVLIVPGHDDKTWGAQYGTLKEADMNLAVATRIYDTLKNDNRFEVYITRDTNGYVKEFADYFANNRAEIIAFEKAGKKVMQEKLKTGELVKKDNAPHGTASDDMAIKLFGINKWADENKMDAVIHVHFNDYSGRKSWSKGERSGFVIYMPDPQFANGKGSAKLAKSVFDELHKNYATSNYYMELGGLIPDQKLIALGVNNTLISSVNSILIEYGYIYEFGDRAKREKAYENMAKLTVAGLKSYFNKF